MLKILKGALKHGLSERQILEAYADPLRLEQAEPDCKGIAQDIIVGSTLGEVILEIKVRYERRTDIIFHAKKAGAHLQVRYRARR